MAKAFRVFSTGQNRSTSNGFISSALRTKAFVKTAPGISIQSLANDFFDTAPVIPPVSSVSLRSLMGVGT